MFKYYNVYNSEEGPLYGLVNKPKHNQETGDSDNKKSQGPVQVQKSGKHGTDMYLFRRLSMSCLWSNISKNM